MSAVLSQILPKTEILSYDALSMYKLVSELKNTDILGRLNQKYLVPLMEYDEKNNSDMTDFVSAYIEYNGHIKDISENLYLHRNTVYYKIKKAEELLGCSLSNLDTKLFLLIALMSRKFADKM